MDDNNTLLCIKSIADELSNIALMPRPHLSVLGTAWEDTYGYASEEKADIEDEGRQFSKNMRLAEPTLAEVEEKFRFIPNRCKYELKIKTTGKEPKITLVFSFFNRVRHSEIIPTFKDEFDPDAENNFKESKIKFEIPILYPFQQKSIVDENNNIKEVVSEFVDNYLIIRYDWVSYSDPYKTLERKNKSEDIKEIKHKYQVNFVIKIKKIEDNNTIVSVELTNSGDQSRFPCIYDANKQKNMTINKYTYGYLLNFCIDNTLNDCEIIDIPNTKNISPYTENGIFDFPLSECKFKDHTFVKEIIPKMKHVVNNGQIEKPSTTLGSLNVNNLIGEALENGPKKYPSLYKFQRDAIERILSGIDTNEHEIFCVSARTAGGKTETFMIPILNYCLNELDKIGTKSILVYPTKALSNDQANRTISLLTYINEKLEESNKRKITIGVYHGDIDDEKIKDISFFKCPYCDEIMHATDDKNLICNNGNCDYNLTKSKPFICDYILFSRKEMHVNPPDILITNPDMINTMLLRRPESHAIFGRKDNMLRCSECGDVFISSHKRKNHKYFYKYTKCKGHLDQIKKEFTSPKFIVLDEIHLMFGSFGIHVSYVLSRLKNIIKKYDRESNLVYIASSATIRNPHKFLSEMYGVTTDKISVFPDKDKYDDYYENESDESVKRFHLFMMPNAYKTALSLSFAYYKLLEFFKKNDLGIPNVLTFVNSISASNSLISTTRNRLLNNFDVSIDGHSTEFDKRDRARKENKFNRNEINFLFATKTLEVGVDFDRINILGIFGSPYSFNDFIQRIGRAGRKQNAIILTFFRSFNPVDNFYYSKSYEFMNYDKSIREKYMEDLPINRNNSVIIKKSVDSALIEFLNSHQDAHEYIFVDARPFFENIYNPRTGIKSNELLEFIKNSISPSSLSESELIRLLERIITKYYDKLHGSQAPLKSLISESLEKRFLTNLRSADPELELLIPSRLDDGKYFGDYDG